MQGGEVKEVGVEFEEFEDSLAFGVWGRLEVVIGEEVEEEVFDFEDAVLDGLHVLLAFPGAGVRLVHFQVREVLAECVVNCFQFRVPEMSDGDDVVDGDLDDVDGVGGEGVGFSLFGAFDEDLDLICSRWVLAFEEVANDA